MVNKRNLENYVFEFERKGILTPQLKIKLNQLTRFYDFSLEINGNSVKIYSDTESVGTIKFFNTDLKEVIESEIGADYYIEIDNLYPQLKKYHTFLYGEYEDFHKFCEKKKKGGMFSLVLDLEENSLNLYQTSEFGFKIPIPENELGEIYMANILKKPYGKLLNIKRF